MAEEPDVKIEVAEPAKPEPMRHVALPTTIMTWFLADITNAPVPLTNELYELMVRHAREYLAVGGIPDWRDWRVLDEHQRRAWIQAADELKIRAFLDRMGAP